MTKVSISLYIITAIWEFIKAIISGSPFREWCVFVAEILVALVIYLELSHTRSSSFLEKATNEEANHDRSEIYSKFLELPGSRQTKSEAFCEMILKTENATLKRKCERQIALFSELGFSTRKPLWSWRGRWENRLVSLLPHPTVYMWVILRPYILKRRADTGPWYAGPFLSFSLRSVDFVRKYKRTLH